MINKKYISGRFDRYGSNYIPAISYIFLCEQINNEVLYHNCNDCCKRYKKSILHQYLLDKTRRCNDLNITKNDIHTIHNPPGQSQLCLKYITEEIFRKTNKSFPDLFHDSKIYDEIRNRYFDRYGHDSFTKNSIVIHIRLDDRHPDITRKPNSRKQNFIGVDNLIKLINSILKFELNIFYDYK